MRIKDMLLVTNSNKGTEYKYLAGIEDYMTTLFKAFEGSEAEVAHAVKELCQTKENSRWAEVYLAANKTFSARFCSSGQELRDFLLGTHKMAGREAVFDRERCTKGCLEVVTAYNMDCGGHPLIGKLHYEKQDYTFRQGETLHNLNGCDYCVLMTLNERDLFLMALNSGQFLIAQGTRAYARYPKEGSYSPDSIIRGIEWEHGVYLGNDLSVIDLDSIQREYASDRDTEQDESSEDEEQIPQISAPVNMLLQEQLDRAQTAGEGMQEEIQEKMQIKMQVEEREEEDYGERADWYER